MYIFLFPKPQCIKYASPAKNPNAIIFLPLLGRGIFLFNKFPNKLKIHSVNIDRRKEYIN